MFLQIMSDTRNISRHFHTIRQTDTSNFPQSRVWFLRGRRCHFHANTTLERTLRLGDAVFDGIGNESHRRGLGFSDADLSWSLDELVNRGHSGTLVKNYVKNKERTLACSVMLILPKRVDIVNIPLQYPSYRANRTKKDRTRPMKRLIGTAKKKTAKRRKKIP